MGTDDSTTTGPQTEEELFADYDRDRILPMRNPTMSDSPTINQTSFVIGPREPASGPSVNYKIIGPCVWTMDDPDKGVWESSCGNAFTIIVGSPTQNDMRFCCYCGHPLKEQP